MTNRLASQPLLAMPSLVERSGISERAWRRILASGAIGFVRIGGSVRVPECELERFLQERFTPASETPRKRTPVSVSQIVADVARRHQGRGR